MCEHKEINGVRPTSLNHLVGNDQVKEQVHVAIEAAFADQRRFDDALLVGPPGLGKTQLACVIACEMATNLHEVLGQSVKTPADLNGVLLAAKDKDIIHFDEVHELKKPFQTALYRAIEEKKLFVQGGASRVQNLPLADFTVLLSTTDEHHLMQPLRDRMRLLLRFQFYTDADLTVLLCQRCQAIGWRVDERAFPLIAQRSRGTPRLALRLLQSCRRVCRAEGDTTITVEHLERACQLEQIDALGLGHSEKQYLQLLADGISRLNVLASMLGLPPSTVSQVTEPFLIRAGLMLKDDQSRRQLTAKGREHLSNLRQQSV